VFCNTGRAAKESWTKEANAMGDPADPRELSYEEEALLEWAEKQGPSLPEEATDALHAVVADLLKRSYDQGMSDCQQVAQWNAAQHEHPSWRRHCRQTLKGCGAEMADDEQLLCECDCERCHLAFETQREADGEPVHAIDTGDSGIIVCPNVGWDKIMLVWQDPEAGPPFCPACGNKVASWTMLPVGDQPNVEKKVRRMPNICARCKRGEHARCSEEENGWASIPGSPFTPYKCPCRCIADKEAV
jgi:hypothetical protein